MQENEEHMRAGGREAWPKKIIEMAGEPLSKLTTYFGESRKYAEQRNICPNLTARKITTEKNQPSLST